MLNIGVSYSLIGRVAVLVSVSCGVIAIVAITGASMQSQMGDTDVSRLLWFLPVFVAACFGLSTLRICRQASLIESELERIGRDGSWRRGRPVILTGTVGAGWNALIDQAQGRSLSEERGNGDVSVAVNGFLARAVRSLPVGLAITDSTGVIRVGNLPLAALVCCPDAEALAGQDAAAVLKADEAENADEIRAHFTSQARTIAFTIRRGSSAEDGVLRVNRNKLAGRDGDADGFVFLVQDITQQTISIEARDQFLHTASHELRMPLANLKAYAEALAIEDGIEIEEQKQFCNIINDETTRLARLVDELLAVGQMEAGSMVLNRSEIDFGRSIREVAANLQSKLDAKAIQLELAVSPKLPVVIGDKDKLHAALSNVVGNAVKYTPDNGEIHVSVDSEDSWLRIRVQDTGIGIAEEDHERVFEKFYRCTGEEVAEQAGNGLGLAFAREIVRRHGGDLQLQSSLGEGSVFSLHLPVSDNAV